MIQDIAPRKLDNGYIQSIPNKESKILIFHEKMVLIRHCEDGTARVPSFQDIGEIKNMGEGTDLFQFLFSIGEQDYFLWRPCINEGTDLKMKAYAYEKIRLLRGLIPKEDFFGVMTGYHLYIWYKDNQYCGRCGTQVIHDGTVRMLRCPGCSNMIFPKVAPAVIIALTDGNKILMSKYADREYTKYALLAGFTEIGETAEETVAREVMEEVGLKVKNIQYYKSQPWGVDCNLLLGFFAELDGSNQIKMDEKELSFAEWFDRSKMPAHDDGISLTREMMGVFENKERYEAFRWKADRKDGAD